MELQLEKCTLRHLDRLQWISQKTFADAFEHQNDPNDFQEYMDSAFSKTKLQHELEDPNSDFYFAFRGKDLIGYFKLNVLNAQTDVRKAEAVELERIYVLKEFQGLKIGKWMLDEVKSLARQKKKEFLWLGVWELNPAAIRFYKKHGFAKFGEHPYYIGDDKQIDWLMRYYL